MAYIIIVVDVLVSVIRNAFGGSRKIYNRICVCVLHRLTATAVQHSPHMSCPTGELCFSAVTPAINIDIANNFAL